MKKGYKCCLCGKRTLGWGDNQQYGNNPRPLAEGECCNECNATKVISARLRGLN